MSVAIMVTRNQNIGVPYTYGFQLIPTIVTSILVMAVHIPSAALIIYLPISTKEENGAATWAFVAAGVIMSLVGLLIGLATAFGYSFPYDAQTMVLDTGNYFLVGYIFVILSIFPFALTIAITAFAWGTFVPKRWGFDIAGIELED